MRLSRRTAYAALVAVTCLACDGSVGSALPSAHHPSPKHSQKSSHAVVTAKAPIAIQSVPLPPELPGHGAFIMSMCTDHDGVTFFGTEEEGIWAYDRRLPPQSRWHHWTAASNGLGDDTAYCLCVDRKNRVFAGTNNSGVNVWNGHAWKNYSQLTGPLGAHVYAMAVSPVTGSVFMATEAGIAVYKEAADSWDYILAPMGKSLPQATSLTFNKSGDLILGSQTDGIFVGRAASGFTHWDHIPGPDYMPRSASGAGLPTGEINCLLTARDGNTIWAGTRCGVAASVDGGSHWQFWRGADYRDKVNGLYSNRPYDATVSGLELMTVPQYQKFIAVPGAKINPAAAIKTTPPATNIKTDTVPSTWISLDAADDPVDQMGVHITVLGGDANKSQAMVDTSKAKHPAPAGLYADERQGNFTYTFQNLAPHMSYMLRLHFAELDFNGVGQRQFLVTANGSPALPPLDVFDKSGGEDIALSQDVPVTTDAYGTLTLAFSGLRPEVYQPPTPAPSPDHMLSQDYVTSLAQDRDGRIYIGHWQNALECYDPASQTFNIEGQTAAPGTSTASFVSSLLPLQGGGVLVGGYGNGITYAGLVNTSFPASTVGGYFPAVRNTDTPFPAPAKPPTTEKLQELLTELSQSGQSTMKPGDGAYMSSDWSTQGNWIGKFGQKYTIMCAADSPLNHYFINDFDYSADGDLGPNRVPTDSIRRWIHWLRTSDARVMSDPVIGTRRESEFDDHGEDYNMQIEGPDLWITVQVPAGVHRLSAYFMNKDGHGGSNELRDYTLDLLPYRTDPRASAFLKPLAVGRVRQFWGGVYQSFAVCGPAKFYLKIARSNSFNTIVSAILLDKISGPPTHWDSVNAPCAYLSAPEYQAYITPPAARAAIDSTLSATLPLQLWSDLTDASGNASWCSAVVPARMLCYRALAASLAPGNTMVGQAAPGVPKSGPTEVSLAAPIPITGNDLLAWWRRSLPFVTPADRAAYTDTMTRAWKDELALCPSLNRNDL